RVLGSPLSIGQWYHVVGTYDGSDLRIYLNGALDINEDNPTGSTPHSGPIDTSNWPLYIGRETTWDEWFHGIIDEAAIYSRALSAEEILQHYQNGL
ncbi:MAG: LamG domain-containing protein, partial [bacterium]|nr:LamG domain-containing protein [bacterium]